MFVGEMAETRHAVDSPRISLHTRINKRIFIYFLPGFFFSFTPKTLESLDKI